MMLSSVYCFEVTVHQILAGYSYFSLFSQEGEVTSPLISGPAWTLRLQFTRYQQRYAPMIFIYLFIFIYVFIYLLLFFFNSTYSLYPEPWIIQEPVYVLHLITCHGRIMPRLAELLFIYLHRHICITSSWHIWKQAAHAESHRTLPKTDRLV